MARAIIGTLVAALCLASCAAQTLPIARTCTASPEEQAFCEELLPVMNAAQSGVEFTCVEYGSVDECIDAIAADQADWRALDGGDIHLAWQDMGLRVIASENYGNDVSGGEYYAVAVVNADFCETDSFIDFQTLSGLRSCHTGYRKTAGWRMPLGTLLSNDNAQLVSDIADVEDDAEIIASYFSVTCAPRTSSNGPRNTDDGDGALWDPLCTGCTSPDIDSDEDRCTTADPYYDYPGAFRCLTEGAGDVAFVKHTTVPDFAADGNTPADWATKNTGEFRLLCPSGGCQFVNEFATCNLAKVPAHAVVASPAKDIVVDGTLADALVALGDSPDFTSVVFNGNTNEDDFLFKSSTVEIDRVDGDTGSYLGTAGIVFDFLESIQGS